LSIVGDDGAAEIDQPIIIIIIIIITTSVKDPPFPDFLYC